jgi:DNA-directed RNA polymerase subunit RPC12/RpoP
MKTIFGKKYIDCPYCGRTLIFVKHTVNKPTHFECPKSLCRYNTKINQF